MYTDYKMLSVAPLIFKVLSWTTIVFGAIASVIVLAGGVLPEIPRWMGLVTLMVSAFYFFIFTVVSEVIRLLQEIKEKVK